MKEETTLDKLGGNALSAVAKRFFGFPSGRLMPNNPLYSEDVNHLTELVHETISAHISNKTNNAQDQFAKALALRADLLQRPEIQNHPEARQYVEGIVAITDDGDTQKSIELTVELYAENMKGNLPDVISQLDSLSR